MSRYIQIKFNNISEEQSGMLIAWLSEAGFEGFEEKENELTGFIAEESFDESEVQGRAGQLSVVYTTDVIEETNWNEVWESNFSPVVVEDFAGIRAHFHEPLASVDYEIVITPKMSFGTGHHATTYLMIREMKEIDLEGKKVFDFGTGTGVLAILAEKLGARDVLAIDNDRWSIDNASENIRRNQCTKIRLQLADTPVRDENFDVILANINKSVILGHVSLLSKQIAPGGCIVFSGLLPADEEEVIKACEKEGLKLVKKSEKDNWLLLKVAP